MKENLREADFSKFKKLNGDLLIRVTKQFIKLILKINNKFKKIFNLVRITYKF